MMGQVPKVARRSGATPYRSERSDLRWVPRRPYPRGRGHRVLGSPPTGLGLPRPQVSRPRRGQAPARADESSWAARKARFIAGFLALWSRRLRWTEGGTRGYVPW
jgi:hypothetical protein